MTGGGRPFIGALLVVELRLDGPLAFGAVLRFEGQMNRRSFLSWLGFAATAVPVAGKAVLASVPPAKLITDSEILRRQAGSRMGQKIGTIIRIRLPNDYVINESAFLLDNRHNGSRTTARTIWLPDQSA